MVEGTTYSMRGVESGKWIEIKYGQDGVLQEEADQISVDSAPDAFDQAKFEKWKAEHAVKQ